MQDLSKYLNGAKRAADISSEMIRNSFNNKHNIVHKGTVDLVTEVDLASEKILREELTKEFPEIKFYGEEGGGENWRNGDFWIVDPIDGTTNFANRLPHFSISIALCHNGEPLVGVIKNPITNEIFYTMKDGGAFNNDKPIHVSSVSDINNALAVTGFPYNRREHIEEITTRLKNMLMHVQDVRRFGSAALDLCYLAKGIYSIYWEKNLKPWDVAAGQLLLEEAGGKITRYDGSKMELDSLELLATNGILHEQSIEILKL